MDGENGSGMLKECIPLQQHLEVHGDKPSLPVMAMDNVWPKLHGLARFQDGFAEKNKPFAVIRIIPLRTAINSRTPEVAFMVDEIHGNPFIGFGGADVRGLDTSRAHRDPYKFPCFFDAEFLAANGFIFGKDYSNIVALLSKLFRQGAHHVP